MIVFDSNAQPVTMGDHVYSSKDKMTWEIIGFIGSSVILHCGPSEQSVHIEDFMMEFVKV